MNRLTFVHRRRLLGIAAAVWLISASNASAQFALPGSTPQATFDAKAAVASTPTLADGQKWIEHARSALNRKDYQSAVTSYRQAAALGPKMPQLASEIAKLRLDLQVAGIDSQLLTFKPLVANQAPLGNLSLLGDQAMLAAPPTGSGTIPSYAANPLGQKPGVTPLPRMPVAQPLPSKTSELTSRKREALRLLAVGRAALDRGDTATANQIARQAQALNVPEREFGPDEPRVWQFVLDAEAAAKRSGVMQASASSPIQTAGGKPASESDVIAQMLFNADQNSGTSPAGAIKQVQAEEFDRTPMEQRSASLGEQSYQAGLQALQQGDQETARQHFVEAWQHEGDLPLQMRRQLKDKLTLLQPSRLPKVGSEAAAELTPIQKTELEAREAVSRLYREITTELAKTAEVSKTAPLDALDQLNRLRRRVDGSNVDDLAKRSLIAQVDRALTEQKKFIEANRAKIELDLENEAVRSTITNERALESSIDEEVSSLVDTYNEFMKERRFQEAEVIAKKVAELKPDSTIAIQMFHNSRMGTRRLMNEEIAADKEENFAISMLDVERSASQGIHPDRPYAHGDAKDWQTISNLRLNDGRDDSRLSAAEQAIQRKLTNEVNATYNQRPLNEVLSDLSAMAGVPIVMDNRALSAVRVMPDTPVSLDIPNGIALKSALNIILGQLELTHTIENDVLTITSVEAKRSKVYPDDLSRRRPGHTDSELYQQLRRRFGWSVESGLSNDQSAIGCADHARLDHRSGARQRRYRSDDQSKHAWPIRRHGGAEQFWTQQPADERSWWWFVRRLPVADGVDPNDRRARYLGSPRWPQHDGSVSPEPQFGDQLDE